MLKNTIYRILERRHFWRYASFSEVAELYASRTLRFVGINLASGFASVYLYKTGYSLRFIIIFWICYFSFKALFSIPAALIAARIGPKHGILISNILYIPAMIALGLVPNYGMPAIILWALFMSSSATIYSICYLIDFSKIKSLEHAGKEIGFVNILEKIAVGISPVIGGFVALWFGPQAVMMAGALAFSLAALPLFKTMEQTKTHQKISLLGFPYRLVYRSLISQTGVGFDIFATGYVWGLFIAIVIFPHITDAIYLTLGALSSVTILTAIGVSYAYGRLIDRQKGGDLLRISVIVNSLVHASRPFAVGASSVVATNIANEIATTGINMSYVRGLFDSADLSGHRIVYISMIDAMTSLGSVIACVALLICTTLVGQDDGLRVFFFVTAIFVLLVGTPHFRIYRR